MDLSQHIPLRVFSDKYIEFREKGYFLDCEYRIDQNTYKAHKIILSIYSTLLRSYFTSKNSQSQKSDVCNLPIPYNPQMFEQLVNYFYGTTITLDKVDTTKLFPWLSMGYLYGVKTIIEIIEPIIFERFLKDEKDENVDIILNFSDYYRKIHFNYECQNDYPQIEQNLINFMESQKLFVNYFAKRFESLIEPNQKRLSKLTPFLLSEILKNVETFDDERKVHIIENYVKVLKLQKETLSLSDRRILQNVIDWNNDKSFHLFSYDKLEWVTPDVARPQIVKLLRVRRQALHQLDSESSDILSNPKINHWNGLSIINHIENPTLNPDGYKGFYPILRFLGTLGDSKKVSYINPKKYRLFSSSFFPSLKDSMNFDGISVFDCGKINKETYYCSKCTKIGGNNIPFITISFPDSSIELTRVDVISQCEVMSKRPKQMKLILDGYCHQISKIVDDRIVFELDDPTVTTEITVQLHAEDCPSYFALRVHRLEIHGRFLPYT